MFRTHVGSELAGTEILDNPILINNVQYYKISTNVNYITKNTLQLNASRGNLQLRYKL